MTLPTFPDHAGDLATLTSHIVGEGAYDVDAREWHEEWHQAWVAFVDLIGFSAISERSKDTVLNVTVRFHRALTATSTKYPAARFLRFTDSAYIIAESPTEILKIASDLQHYCLALNAIRLDRPTPAWAHLVVPRMTIAYGWVLDPPSPLPDEARYLGIDGHSLVIGEAIVFAYRSERGTAGSLTSVRSADADLARQIGVRGNRGWPRTALERWAGGSHLLTHDGVVDFPWLLLRSSQPAGDEIWTADKASMATKLDYMYRQWQFMFRDYVYNQHEASVGKQYTLINRHLISLFDLRDGQRPAKVRTIEWLHDNIP